MITFIISGFWHGANWTYIIWGALHGFYQIMEKYVLKFKLPKAINWLIVFGLTCLAWVFFRAPSVSDAMTVLQRIVTFQGTGLYFGDKGIFLFGVMGLFILLLHDYIMEFKPNYQFLYHRSPIVRYAAIVILMMFITTFGVFDNSQFIYFQF